MKNELFFEKNRKKSFSSDFFLLELGEVNEELKEKIAESIFSFIEKYTNDINYKILDEADMRNIFENIQYFMSFYAFKKDISVKDEILDTYSFINESFKFYKDTINSLKERIDRLYDDNPLKNLPEVIVYIERLKLTLKSYENLVSCNLETQQIEFMPLSYTGNEYLLFSLVDDNEVGFYYFNDVISNIEYQFEFYRIFDENSIIRVYKNLNFDVASNGEEYKYTNVLTPVLQQYLFCCEYSADPTSLILTEDSVKNIGVDLKIFFTQKEEKDTYYVLSEEDFKKAVSLINSSKLSEYYESKLIALIKDFRYNESICSINSKVCLKSTLDRLISNLKELKGYDNNYETSNKLIDILTKNSTSILYKVDYIEDEYMNILLKSLKNDNSFKNLSDSTKKYVLSNVPDVRKSLLAFKKMKNIAFLV